ncbi:MULTISPECIES: ketopantoate reductase family protein [Bacillaceae]|uniref:2-dehydropantoate 2-reductase n=1 Tax=Evansella alkalicola TaxID=745819 RepID=A0ABS6JPG4_9BACI|nr:2-dehydropantoate 2-reductase [Litchfieldia alkalitelluris]MBU9720454.1 2-dehydropantoate 2-reductase [Bacillus alkalicola]
MKITIIGGGAVGLLTSGYLTELGHEVDLITKTEEQASLIHKHGVTIKRKGIERSYKVRVTSFQNNLSPNADLYIITLKQWHLHDFFLQWNGTKQPILMLQNGMGHMETAMEYLTESSLYAGSVTHGALKIDEVTVEHTGIGDIVIGPWLNNCPPLVDLIDEVHTHFPIHYTNDIQYILKRKLLINLVVNPLTCIYQVKNGELLNNPYFYKNVRGLFEEGIQVLGLDDLEWEVVKKVISQTSENKSSMFRDMEKGLPTEVEAITGYVLKVAEHKGISLPLTSFVHKSILGLERGKCHE